MMVWSRACQRKAVKEKSGFGCSVLPDGAERWIQSKSLHQPPGGREAGESHGDGVADLPSEKG